MKLGLLILLLLVSVYADTYSPLSYVDRPCGMDLSNLWLDVVVVVDNSQGMTNNGLDNVAANILNVFSSGTRIGSNSSEPRTTRLGLVTYNSNATQQADLNKYQSINDAGNGIFDSLSTVVYTADSYLATGLTLAEKMFIEQSVNTIRGHYKRVVIVYASEYNEDGELDPLSVANRLKLSNVKIITVAYEQPGSVGLENGLSQIASPGFSFSNNVVNISQEIQNALLQSNCFCPSNWIQYHTSYSDPASSRYGVCLQLVGVLANWVAAKNGCRMKSNTNLATEFNQAKHDFILEAVKDNSGFQRNPYQYHIGLNYINDDWVWDQPAGQPPVKLQSWFNWGTGFPNAPASQSAVSNIQSGVTTKWTNVAMYTGAANYVCETYSCDTDNYCDDNY
ncbi:hypothetical protein CRE_04172 [Caenorhabditis remanei]|uniref:VWFA domain-containing protein n=1 Tax=Caenorhabditis remanei TaxID=31234 RepID=E3MYT6_CAERE|nr:hypothetical protein CRE_04172 [Caenorhabditis remanei]